LGSHAARLNFVKMKLCPKCKSNYTDDTLSFCLQDGAQLIALTNEPLSSQSSRKTLFSKDAPTIPMHQMQTLELSEDETTVESKRPIVITEQQRKSSPILIIGVVVIALCLVALVGIGAVFLAKDFLFSNQNNQKNENKLPVVQLKIKASASSTREDFKGINYAPPLTVDGDLTTAWIEGGSGKGIGEWLLFDFGETVTLKEIKIYPGYFKNKSIWSKNNRLASVTVVFSDGSSRRFSFADKMEAQTVNVGNIKTNSVKLVIEDVYAGETDFEDTAVSELNFIFE